MTSSRTLVILALIGIISSSVSATVWKYDGCNDKHCLYGGVEEFVAKACGAHLKLQLDACTAKNNGYLFNHLAVDLKEIKVLV